MNNRLAHDQPILVFIGPSGTGKSTLVDLLTGTGLIDFTPTWTDRPVRPDEKGLEHFFVSTQEFEDLEKDDFFAHPSLALFGLPYRYALPQLTLPPEGTVPTIMARVSALPTLDKIYPNYRIYQIEAPKDSVAARLQARAEAGDQVGTRLKDYDKEITEGRKHASRIFVNDSDMPTLVEQVSEAIRQDFFVKS